jgi:dolichol-phosphate mannosyltransferase
LSAEEAAPAAPLSVHRRIRHGVRRRHNWVQFARFAVVGGSGYVVNLLVFALAHKAAGAAPLVAATVAFMVAFLNNFAWNRKWTFAHSEAAFHRQAWRFFVVSVLAFLVAAGVLQLLLALTGLPAIVAQAVSIVVATPLSFAGNKMWSFEGEDAAA